MSDRLTKAEVDALVENVPESLFLTAEYRAQLREYKSWRKQRKKEAGSRPPNTYGEECGDVLED